MHSKNNRLNHDFQILHFIVGRCHTADAAYGVLKDLEQDRIMALNAAKAGEIRKKAKELDIKRRLESDDEVTRLEAEADWLEFQNDESISELNVKAAEKELKFIQDLIQEVNQYRRFKDLPDDEAFELAQRDEWKYELLERAQNQLMLTGTINPEDFVNIKAHPDSMEIMQEIENTQKMLTLPNGRMNLMKMVTARPDYFTHLKALAKEEQKLQLIKE